MESWSGKGYHSWSWHLQSVFGEKVAKISLDAGFGCPHRVGSSGGCIYCSPRGSGDFAGKAGIAIPVQFQEMVARVKEKWPGVRRFIPYFQAYTNTLAPVSRLESLYNQALEQEGVVGLSISTRPDCLPQPVLDLLAELNHRTWLWVELGLQSSHDSTLRGINRGHNYASFVQAVEELKKLGIKTCAHIILGLPGETEEMMLQTARALAALNLEGIKIHLLNVIKNTPLAEMWQRGQVPLPDMATYVRWVVDILELLPPEMVIHRLTGDSPAPLLLAPAWSLRKWEVLMAIEAEMNRRQTWQGKKYQP